VRISSRSLKRIRSHLEFVGSTMNIFPDGQSPAE
jgi:hypothetical protein